MSITDSHTFLLQKKHQRMELNDANTKYLRRRLLVLVIGRWQWDLCEWPLAKGGRDALYFWSQSGHMHTQNLHVAALYILEFSSPSIMDGC